MRAAYIAPSQDEWEEYYMDQAEQAGAGFIGMPYQRGGGLGSIFRGIFRALLPIAKSAGKSIGRQALATGAQIAADVAGGEGIKAATKRRGREGLSNALETAHRKLQDGSGVGKRPKNTTSKVKKPTAKRQKVEDPFGFYYI